MTDWTSLRYVVVDLEGNGQHPADLVELAVVPIEQGHIGEPHTWLVRPDEPITGFARRIHGISNELVAGAPTFSEIEVAVRDALGSAVFIAHNAPVDLGVLRRKLVDWEPVEVMDTVKLARRLRPDLKSHRLGNLVESFDLDADLPPDLKPHRATYDALVTARLFVHLVKHTYPEVLSLEDLRGQTSPGDDDEATTLF